MASGDLPVHIKPSVDHMTPAERGLYVQGLWDRMAAEPEGIPLTKTVYREWTY